MSSLLNLSSFSALISALGPAHIHHLTFENPPSGEGVPSARSSHESSGPFTHRASGREGGIASSGGPAEFGAQPTENRATRCGLGKLLHTCYNSESMSRTNYAPSPIACKCVEWN